MAFQEHEPQDQVEPDEQVTDLPAPPLVPVGPIPDEADEEARSQERLDPEEEAP